MPGSSFVSISASDGGSFKAYLAVPEAGRGPGIVLLQEIFGVNADMRAVADLYAEEGYTVLAPDLFWRIQPGIELGHDEAGMKRAFECFGAFDIEKGVGDIAATADALRKRPDCSGQVGALGFCLGGKLAYLAAAHAGVDCAVAYYGVGLEQLLGQAASIRCPMVFHFGELDKWSPPAVIDAVRGAFAGRSDVAVFTYPGCDHAFSAASRPSFNKPASMVAHSRSITLFRRVLGPYYDLEHLWDLHTLYEFGERDVPKTMATMVAEPYVNHVPTMTGGVGYKNLSRFYQNHFVHSNPADTRLIPISRTVGVDRLVDEFLFCFTHDREIDWILPGVEPTGKYVEVPMLGVISFRGDKLFNEHIYWDQASVLVQIGLLDSKGLPVSGIEQSRKLLDEKLPSNSLMERWAESEPKAAAE